MLHSFYQYYDSLLHLYYTEHVLNPVARAHHPLALCITCNQKCKLSWTSPSLNSLCKRVELFQAIFAFPSPISENKDKNVLYQSMRFKVYCFWKNLHLFLVLLLLPGIAAISVTVSQFRSKPAQYVFQFHKYELYISIRTNRKKTIQNLLV